MPKEIEFEGGKIIEAGMDIVLIPKQNVEFSDPPAPETEEARIKHRDKMIEFIHKQGFRMGMDNPERRFLIVDGDLAIGIFHSLAEIYDYVKQGYPAADIEKYKSSLVAEGYPEDFHKLPPEVRERWDKLPEETKQAIRDNGANIVEVQKIEEMDDGEKIFQPNSKFQSKPNERGTTDDEKHLKYIQDSGFQKRDLGNGEIGVKIDSKHIIGPFLSLGDAYRYLKEGHHLADIEVLKQMDEPTVH